MKGAFDYYLIERMAKILNEKNVDFLEKKMFGGVCIMIDEKMAMGVTNKNHMMFRVGPDLYDECLSRPGGNVMGMTGRVMKGFIRVEPEGYDNDSDLEDWIDYALQYNPLAKKSKKKKKK